MPLILNNNVLAQNSDILFAPAEGESGEWNVDDPLHPEHIRYVDANDYTFYFIVDWGNKLTLTNKDYRSSDTDVDWRYNTRQTFYKGDLIIPESISHNGSTYHVVKIGSRAADHCVITSLVVPEGVEEIGYGAFSQCERLASVSLPQTIKRIKGRVFWNNAFTSITIPKSIDTLDERCLYQCTKLTTLTIEGRIKYVGPNVCYNCSALTDVWVMPIAPPSLSDNDQDFQYHFPRGARIHVPCVAVQAYIDAPLWTKNHTEQSFRDNQFKYDEIGESVGIKEFLEDIYSHVHITDCECSDFVNVMNQIDTINIHEGGSLSFDEYEGEHGAVSFLSGKVINVEKELPVLSWSLIGNLNSLADDEDSRKYTFLDNTIGVEVNPGVIVHNEFAALPFDYDVNKWSQVYPEYTDYTPEKFGAIMVWPFRESRETYEYVDGETVYNFPYSLMDATTTLVQTISGENVNGTRGDIEFTQTNRGDDGEGNPPFWFALSNPFLGRLSLQSFYEQNEDMIEDADNDIAGTTAYVWVANDDPTDEREVGDWVAVDMQDEDVMLLPAAGFMVEGTRQTSTFVFNKKEVSRFDVYTAHTYKSEEVYTKMEFTANADGVKKTMTAKLEEDVAEDGYDFRDSHIMFSASEEAVNPYFLVEGHNLFSNRFSSLPYLTDINFNAYKDKQIEFSLSKACSNIEATLIDLVGETETVLVENEPVIINLTEGSNSGRYQIRFTKKNVGINELASEETNINIWNNKGEINIQGKDLKRVEIFNTLGQKVYSSKLAGNSAVFDSSLKEGAYIVKVQDAKTNKTEKIVIR